MKLRWTPNAAMNAPAILFDPAARESSYDASTATLTVRLMDRFGFETSAGTPQTSLAMGRPGSAFTAMSIPGRVLSVKAKLIALSRADYWQFRHVLSASLATPHGGIWAGILTLDRSQEGVSPPLLSIEALPRESPRADGMSNLADNVDIEWVCESPYWVEPTEQQTSFTIDQPGGVTFPLSLPVVFPDAAFATSFTVTNSGSAESYPRFVLAGPLVNVRLMNTTTGRKLKVLYTVDAGETLVVDMAPQTRRVDLESGGGTTDLIGRLTADSRFWGIRAGDNNISIEIDSSTSGSGGMYWQPAHAGV